MLSDHERAKLKELIDAGQPLPAQYRAALFPEPSGTELIWPGKTRDTTSVVLPFQSIEQIDEPRSEADQQALELFSVDAVSGRQSGGWTNKLIWGDNKLVLSSLKSGPLRKQIEAVGGLKLVYIDPPFDVGDDFSVQVQVGEADSVTKQPSVIEEVAYRDTWGRGTDSYLAMLHERLILIHSLLADDGSFVIHCDWRMSAQIRLLVDEVFGRQNFRNELYWYYYNKMPDTRKSIFPRATDTLLWYVKDRESDYFFKPLLEKREQAVKQLVRKKVGGRMVNARDAEGNVMYSERDERVVDNVWRVPMLQPADRTENLGYATQKPERLLERVVEAFSPEGALVADFFCGSGTSLAVAEKLGRKWIGVDLGRFAVHTARKRLIQAQRDLKAEATPYRSFEVLNLGKYERQYFAGIDPTLPEDQRRAVSLQKEEHYLTMILAAYKAERVFQLPPFHGRKAGALVVVGPIDAPVTQEQVQEVIAACKKQRVTRVDVLGFEFEMGLGEHAKDEAKKKGVNLALRYIPKEVFDRRAIDKGQVVFYDLAYVDVKPVVKGKKVTVQLKDFGVYYRQDDTQDIAEALKPGGSRVAVVNGQVVRIEKDKKGTVQTEVLTKRWADWIDYWSVDFDFESRREVLEISRPDGSAASVWTGGYIFENEWQAFRTRKDRSLEMVSASHEYAKKGRYKIAVKVIDIFGNDTTKVVEVSV